MILSEPIPEHILVKRNWCDHFEFAVDHGDKVSYIFSAAIRKYLEIYVKSFQFTWLKNTRLSDCNV